MSKNDRVSYLKSKGLNEGEIGKEMGISRGEVDLVLDMTKK